MGILVPRESFQPGAPSGLFPLPTARSIGPLFGESRAADYPSIPKSMVKWDENEGDKFSDLSETYVIFISEYDVVGNGRAVNSFSYRNDDFYKGNEEIEKNIIPHAPPGGRTHILHVNGDFKDDGSEIGKLIPTSNVGKQTRCIFQISQLEPVS